MAAETDNNGHHFFVWLFFFEEANRRGHISRSEWITIIGLDLWKKIEIWLLLVLLVLLVEVEYLLRDLLLLGDIIGLWWWNKAICRANISGGRKD